MKAYELLLALVLAVGFSWLDVYVLSTCYALLGLCVAVGSFGAVAFGLSVACWHASGPLKPLEPVDLASIGVWLVLVAAGMLALDAHLASQSLSWHEQAASRILGVDLVILFLGALVGALSLLARLRPNAGKVDAAPSGAPSLPAAGSSRLHSGHHHHHHHHSHHSMGLSLARRALPPLQELAGTSALIAFAFTLTGLPLVLNHLFSESVWATHDSRIYCIWGAVCGMAPLLASESVSRVTAWMQARVEEAEEETQESGLFSMDSSSGDDSEAEAPSMRSAIPQPARLAQDMLKHHPHGILMKGSSVRHGGHHHASSASATAATPAGAAAIPLVAELPLRVRFVAFLANPSAGLVIEMYWFLLLLASLGHYVAWAYMADSEKIEMEPQQWGAGVADLPCDGASALGTWWVLQHTFSFAVLIENLVFLVGMPRKPLNHLLSWSTVLDFLCVFPVVAWMFNHAMMLESQGLGRIVDGYAFGLMGEPFLFLRLGRSLKYHEKLVQCYELVQHSSRDDAWRSVTSQSTYLCLSITALFLGCTGLMYALELVPEDTERDFGALHRSLYFVIITLSTVGYGDMVPISDTGKIALSACVLIGISVVPIQISRLMSVIAEARESASFCKRYTKKPFRQHVVICGQITVGTLEGLVVQLLHEDRGSNLEVVLLSRNKPSTELQLLLKSTPMFLNKVFLIKAPTVDQVALRAALVESATAVMVIAARGHPAEEDGRSLLAVLNICKVLRYVRSANHQPVQVIAQCLRSESKLHMRAAGANIVICLEELKDGLLGRSVVAPGISTLICNSLSATDDIMIETALSGASSVADAHHGGALTPSGEQASPTRSPRKTRLRRKSLGEGGSTGVAMPWTHEYSEGIGHEMYKTRAPVGLIGQSALYLCELAFRQMGVMIVGIETANNSKTGARSSSRRISLLPVPDVKIEPEDEVFVLAPDMATAAQVGLLKGSKKAKAKVWAIPAYTPERTPKASFAAPDEQDDLELPDSGSGSGSEDLEEEEEEEEEEEGKSDSDHSEASSVRRSSGESMTGPMYLSSPIEPLSPGLAPTATPAMVPAAPTAEEDLPSMLVTTVSTKNLDLSGTPEPSPADKVLRRGMSVEVGGGAASSRRKPGRLRSQSKLRRRRSLRGNTWERTAVSVTSAVRVKNDRQKKGRRMAFNDGETFTAISSITDHVIVCTDGSRSLFHVLHPLQSHRDSAAVVVLCTGAPSPELLDSVGQFPTTYTIQAAHPISQGDLLKAKIRFARAVIILGDNTDRFKTDEAGKADLNSIITAVHVRRLASSSCKLIVDVADAQSVQFLDPTDWWSTPGLFASYQLSPAYASGMVLPDAALDSFLAMAVFHPSILSCLSRMLSAEAALIDTDSHVFSLKVPACCTGLTFGEFFSFVLCLHAVLPFGLYRSPARSRGLPFAYTNPAFDTELRAGDALFVLTGAKKRLADVERHLGAVLGSEPLLLLSRRLIRESEADAVVAQLKENVEQKPRVLGARGSRLTFVARDCVRFMVECGLCYDSVDAELLGRRLQDRGHIAACDAAPRGFAESKHAFYFADGPMEMFELVNARALQLRQAAATPGK